MKKSNLKPELHFNYEYVTTHVKKILFGAIFLAF